MRARRLLAGLAFFGCAALGVVAVDVASALAPFSTSTSYVAQQAPYVDSGAESGSGGLVPAAGTSVIVGAGDTLWSLAERVDPAADPRDVIAAIMRLNSLDSSVLQAGQVLLVP
ncbi:MAG: LysM peptidoglycan-binding domain-containing protein [Geodermatophilaceae bacterium]